jgi:hypothetical protein
MIWSPVGNVWKSDKGFVARPGIQSWALYLYTPTFSGLINGQVDSLRACQKLAEHWLEVNARKMDGALPVMMKTPAWDGLCGLAKVAE